MPILNHNLTAWEISHRWAGFDPASIRARIPLPVRDNMRLLMDEILQGHLDCSTLLLEKWHEGLSTDPEDHIRHHLPAIQDCIDGKRYDKALMNHAVIFRHSFELWCERRSIPLPDFWFPEGWTDYKWPDDDDETDSQNTSKSDADIQQAQERLTKNRRAKITCQTIAERLWVAHPDWTIKEVASSNEVHTIGGGEEYEFETILKWLSEVDPRDPSQKRGRKKKNN